jgi:hypothetical protein
MSVLPFGTDIPFADVILP